MLFGRGPRRADRRDDAASLGRDFGVGRPAQPAAKLLAAVTREQRVGMPVDESGNDRQRAAVDDVRLRSGGQRSWEIPVRAGKQNALALGRDGAVLDDGQVALIHAAPRRAAGAGDQLADVADNQHWRLSIGDWRLPDWRVPIVDWSMLSQQSSARCRFVEAFKADALVARLL